MIPSNQLVSGRKRVTSGHRMSDAAQAPVNDMASFLYLD